MKKLNWKLFYIIVPSASIFGFIFAFQMSWHLRNIRPMHNWHRMQRNRMDILNAMCLKYNLTNAKKFPDPKVARNMIVEHNHKLIYCEVPKTGCSNWKRVIFLLQNHHITGPSKISHEFIHNTTELKRLSHYPLDWQIDMLRNYNKIMFARDPFQRLVSAYRNKFLHTEQSTYYSKVIAGVIRQLFGNSSFRNGNVTFPAFVNYVLQEDPKRRDIHWNLLSNLCNPCNIQYDVLGKFETLEEDAEHILKVIGAPDHLHFPNIKQHHNDVKMSERLAKDYFRELNDMQLTAIVNMYHLDFSLFNYPIYITN